MPTCCCIGPPGNCPCIRKINSCFQDINPYNSKIFKIEKEVSDVSFDISQLFNPKQLSFDFDI